MSQVLHESATTTEAIRRPIQPQVKRAAEVDAAANVPPAGWYDLRVSHGADAPPSAALVCDAAVTNQSMLEEKIHQLIEGGRQQQGRAHVGHSVA